MTTDKELKDEIKEYLDSVNGDESLLVDSLYWECKAELIGRQNVRKEILEFIENQRDNGNMEGQKGFSAALCLSSLIKFLEKDE